MHKYQARISWSRNGQNFLDNRYSRAHEWTFDGGTRVPASSSPAVVPEPLSTAAAVDPEEALVASASSCHMLWFLYVAAKRRFTVERYVDDAFGVIEKNSEGKLAMTHITLRPKVEFASDRVPSAAELDALHHEAHTQCFVANSLKSEIVIEATAAA